MREVYIKVPQSAFLDGIRSSRLDRSTTRNAPLFCVYIRERKNNCIHRLCLNLADMTSFASKCSFPSYKEKSLFMNGFLMSWKYPEGFDVNYKWYTWEFQ